MHFVSLSTTCTAMQFCATTVPPIDPLPAVDMIKCRLQGDRNNNYNWPMSLPMPIECPEIDLTESVLSLFKNFNECIDTFRLQNNYVTFSTTDARLLLSSSANKNNGAGVSQYVSELIGPKVLKIRYEKVST